MTLIIVLLAVFTLVVLAAATIVAWRKITNWERAELRRIDEWAEAEARRRAHAAEECSAWHTSR